MKVAATVIRENKSEILDIWEEGVRKEIPASAATETLVLRNILPLILNDLADILDDYNGSGENIGSEDTQKIVDESIGHGRHRTSSEEYTPKQIMQEYQKLHKVLIHILRKNKAYNEDVGIVISIALDTSMSYSIDAFTESLQDMRVKLVATLAHDIRNPLSAALLALDISDYKDGEERFRKIKDMTTKSIKRSLKMVEGFLDAVTVQAGEGISLDFEERNLVEDVKLVCWETKESYPNEIKLLVENDEIKGVFDATAVRRLLENLLTNAVKYGAKDEPITVSMEDEPNKVILRVSNNGNSISPEDQKNIFKFLTRGEKNPHHSLQSWGMGLTFVKMAAEVHGGEVEVESGDGGTTFTVTLDKFANKPGKRRVRLSYSE